ncbi:hypothetical protein CHARACLAT_026456 [Characodon lateralis]|uniref:Ig-like domain-containing protein n=1 Tax=Characodon lateralis TaxID=208331 RepID=A0ABU7E3Q7_9TELE|nr:hypothetical protein [Characodon lateralis]
MGPLLTGSLWAVLSAVFVQFVSADQKPIRITAEAGQNIILPCRANDKWTIIVVEWGRTDLKEKEYVFRYRNDVIDPENQHPSFSNRVDLQGNQMKDGDVSLVLKKTTTDDRGTYECRVAQSGTDREKKLLGRVHLDVVSPPGESVSGPELPAASWFLMVE